MDIVRSLRPAATGELTQLSPRVRYGAFVNARCFCALRAASLQAHSLENEQ